MKTAPESETTGTFPSPSFTLSDPPLPTGPRETKAKGYACWENSTEHRFWAEVGLSRVSQQMQVLLWALHLTHLPVQPALQTSPLPALRSAAILKPSHGTTRVKAAPEPPNCVSLTLSAPRFRLLTPPLPPRPTLCNQSSSAFLLRSHPLPPPEAPAIL